MNKMIKYQSQPTDDTCVATCIAMIADSPVEEIIKNVKLHHDKIPMDDLSTARTLARLGYVTVDTSSSSLYAGSLYMVAVPSRCEIGATHMILFDLRSLDSSKWEVYDPSINNKYTRQMLVDGEMSWMRSYKVIDAFGYPKN